MRLSFILAFILLLFSCASPQTESLTDSDSLMQGREHLARLMQDSKPEHESGTSRYQMHGQFPSHAPRPYMVSLRTEEQHVEYRINGEVGTELTVRSVNNARESSLSFREHLIRGLDEPLEASAHLHESILARARVPYALCEFAKAYGKVTKFETAGARSTLRIEFTHGHLFLHTVYVDLVGGDRELELTAAHWQLEEPLLGSATYKLNYSLQATQNSAFTSFTMEGPQAMRMQADIRPSQEDPSLRNITRLTGEWRTAAKFDEVNSRTACTLNWIGQDLAEVLIPYHEARVLALASPQGWIVMEAPVSPRVGDSIITALKQARPDLGFSYVLASHHHPHYVGAFPAFVAHGAIPVVPDEVAAYIEELLRRPRANQISSYSNGSKPVQVVGVGKGKRWSPPGLEHQLVAIEANGQSAHTDAFMIFSLPQHKIGFGGDLLWLPREESGRRYSDRTIGLASLIEQETSIHDYLTSWPAIEGRGLGLRWKNHASRKEILRSTDPTHAVN